MKVLSKFKSLFKKEEPPKTTHEQIEDAVNNLILKLKADGKSIGDESISKGFGSLTIYVHRLDREDALIQLYSEGWELKVKPHFNKF